jgi:hypothetical protein
MPLPLLAGRILWVDPVTNRLAGFGDRIEAAGPDGRRDSCATASSRGGLETVALGGLVFGSCLGPALWARAAGLPWQTMLFAPPWRSPSWASAVAIRPESLPSRCRLALSWVPSRPVVGTVRGEADGRPPGTKDLCRRTALPGTVVERTGRRDKAMMNTACTQCWGYDEVHPCICLPLPPADEPTYVVGSSGTGVRQDGPRVVVLWQRLVSGLA